jgi:hypothetical protein
VTDHPRGSAIIQKEQGVEGVFIEIFAGVSTGGGLRIRWAGNSITIPMV